MHGEKLKPADVSVHFLLSCVESLQIYVVLVWGRWSRKASKQFYHKQNIEDMKRINIVLCEPQYAGNLLNMVG
jgi:hypothetical protein